MVLQVIGGVLSEETIFHKIIRKEIPADVLHEDELCIAFRDINAVSPVHLLVVPKKTLPSLCEAGPDDATLLGTTRLLGDRAWAKRRLALYFGDYLNRSLRCCIGRLVI